MPTGPAPRDGDPTHVNIFLGVKVVSQVGDSQTCEPSAQNLPRTPSPLNLKMENYIVYVIP